MFDCFFCLLYISHTQSLYTFSMKFIYIRDNKFFSLLFSFSPFFFIYSFYILSVRSLLLSWKENTHLYVWEPQTIFLKRHQYFWYVACQRVSRLRCRLIWLCMCAKFATLKKIFCAAATEAVSLVAFVVL